MATQRIFSVYDTKAQAFLPPFFMTNAAVAIRAVASALQDPSHQFAKHATDYVLYELGEWNDVTAIFEQHGTPVNLGIVSSFWPQGELTLGHNGQNDIED